MRTRLAAETASPTHFVSRSFLSLTNGGYGVQLETLSVVSRGNQSDLHFFHATCESIFLGENSRPEEKERAREIENVKVTVSC